MRVNRTKLALLADLHLSMADMAGGRDSKGISIRLLHKLAIIKSVLHSVERQGIYVLVILGDIFESPDTSDLLKRLFYQSLSDYSGQLILLLGNHDYSSDNYYNFSSDKALIAKYGLEDRFLVVSKPVTIDGIDFVPWMPEAQLLDYFTTKNTNSEVLLGHFGVTGAKVSEHDSRHVGEVSTRYLAQYKHIYLGHYHLAQKYYVGSLFRNHHGEANYDCGYVTLNLPDGASERISVLDSNFYTILLDADKEQTLGSAIMQYKTKNDISDLKGSIVKIRIVGHRESIPLVDKQELKKVLSSLGVLSVSFDYEYLRDESNSTILSREFVGKTTMRDQFMLFCKAKKVDQTLTDKALVFLDE